MYVVKVGEYYVARAYVIDEILDEETTKYYIGDIYLSKERQQLFKKGLAFKLANKLNGEVIEMNKGD